jgi:hypothetical protein
MGSRPKPRSAKASSVAAETGAGENLNAAYRQFMAEGDAGRKAEAGKELIRAIFGSDAIARDPVC